MTNGYISTDSDKQLMKHYQDLLDDYIDAEDTPIEDVKEIDHKNPGPNGCNCPMHSDLMTFTQMLEAMDDIQKSLENPVTEEEDIENLPIEDSATPNDSNDDLLEELNKLFTPVLVSQKFEQDIADQKRAEIAESGTLTERTVISFDEPARMSQLVSVCALLIARKKNTENWQLFQKAAAVKKQSKINIQKEEYDEAKALAQKYLVKVTTTNNSSVARDAAQDLLPQTQH